MTTILLIIAGFLAGGICGVIVMAAAAYSGYVDDTEGAYAAGFEDGYSRAVEDGDQVERRP